MACLSLRVMNAQPPPFMPSATPAAAMLPGSGRAEFGEVAADALSLRWAALHEAAGVVAILGGSAAESMGPELRSFPAVMRDAGGWRRSMAEQGIADLAALLEPGIAALLAVQARGVSPAVPAAALWHEFDAARAALLALVPPSNAPFRPRRFA